MDAAPHHECGRPGGLQEGLSDEQRGDGTLGEGEEALSSRKDPTGPAAPSGEGALGLRSGAPSLGEEQREARGKRSAQSLTCEVPETGL